MRILLFLLAYIGVAAVIGFAGKNHKLGFWGYFFVSILFTPLLALFILAVASPKPR